MDMERKIVNLDHTGPRVSKKKKRNTLITLGVLVLLGLGVGAAFLSLGTKAVRTIKGYTIEAVNSGDLVSTVEASGTVVIPTQVTVVSPQEGYADRVLVKEGDEVDKTTILAVLDVPDLIDTRDDLEAQLAVAKLALTDLENDYDYSIRALEISLKRLEKQIADAEKDVKDMKELAGLKTSRQSDYETALDTLEDLQDQQEDARESLEKEKKKRDISLDKQRASITQIELSLKRNRESIEEAKIKSPLAGEVLSISEDLEVAGNLIQKYDELMVIADRTDTYIDFDIGEQYAGVLGLGQDLTATVGTKTLVATITKIGRTASLASDGLTAMVTVRAKPKGDTSLTPGASAVATLQLGTKSGVLTLPRGAYLTTGGQRFVYRVEGNRAVKTQVGYGEIQGNKVEILRGLSAGDRVIVSGYQDFIDEDVVELQ